MLNLMLASRYFNSIIILNDSTIRKASKDSKKMIAEHRWFQERDEYNHPNVFNLQVGDNFYEIVFAAPQYWKWAEDGRRPGKMPPVSAIADWVTRRKIAPYSNKNGKLPSTNQLAFAIAKKIGRDGTTGIHFLEKSVTEAENYFVSKISDAITEDIKENLNFLIVL